MSDDHHDPDDVHDDHDDAYHDDYYESEGVSTLDYVLRGTDLASVIKQYVNATPWWVISVALHFAAALVLVRVMSMARPPRPVDDIVLETEIRQDEPEPLDLKKIEKVFDEIKVETERVVHAPTLVKRPEVEMTETPDFEDDLTTDTSDEFVEDTDFVNMDAATDEAVGDVAGDEEDIFGVGGGFNVRGKTNYDTIMDDLGSKLTRAIRSGPRGGGDLLLVWIMDASVSMKDDQQAIKERLWEMDKKFREQKGTGDLKQAVVYYSDRPHMWLQPTGDVEQVMQAIENIEISAPGTKENTMQAIMYTAQTFSKPGIKARKVGILVDDDSADDSELLESTLKALKKSKMTLFVINRECPFQSQYLHESFKWVDEDGDTYAGTGTVHRGPETARPEITHIRFGHFSWHTRGYGGGVSGGGRILSGFGIYDISRLAYYTGGAYYILDPKPLDIYDWDLMESYRPELVSRHEYENRTSRNPYKRTLELVTKQWNQGLPIWHWFRWPQAPVMLQRCNKKLLEADKLIGTLVRDARMSDSKLSSLKQNRRWPANADLVWASLVLARHRVRQYKYGLEAFLKVTRRIPEDHVITFSPGQKIRETPNEARDREAIIQAMRYVANRHPRTPWGYVASSLDPGSAQYVFGFQFKHVYYFPPFWAKIVFRNGTILPQVYVTNRDKVKKTVHYHVPRKGGRATPEREIKSITPTKAPPSYNFHPRI